MEPLRGSTPPQGVSDDTQYQLRAGPIEYLLAGVGIAAAIYSLTSWLVHLIN